MKSLVINLSNHAVGGGLQISKWLLKRLYLDELFLSKYKVKLIISSSISDWLLKEPGLVFSDVMVLEKSPVRSVRSRKKAMDFCNGSDLVFTLLGPSGLRLENEISGLANAWVTCATFSDYVRTYGFLFPLYIMKYFLHGIRMSGCKKIYFETELSRDNYCKRFHYAHINTAIIFNSVNDDVYNSLVKKERSSNRFLYITAYHKHKNLELLPSIVSELLKNKVLSHFVFTLTLSDDDFERLVSSFGDLDFNICEYVENVGVVEPSELAELYSRTSACISLSDMETFSACYVESLFLEVPLIVLDKPFTRHVCSDYATFVHKDDIPGISRALESSCFANSGLDRKLKEEKAHILEPESRYMLFKKFIEDYELPQ